MTIKPLLNSNTAADIPADPVEKPKHCLRVDFGLTR